MIIYNNEWMYTSFLPLDFAPFNTILAKSANIVDLNTPLNLSCSAQAHPPANYRLYRGQIGCSKNNPSKLCMYSF